MIQEASLEAASLSNFKNIIPPKRYSEIEKLAKKLSGAKIVHLNTSPTGGGVAEILKSLVPLQNGVGLHSRWFSGMAKTQFFHTTKQIHNYLQGKKGDITQEDRDLYLKVNLEVAESLSKLEADLWVIHDPQFAAITQMNGRLHPSIWRSHIDTSKPNIFVWRFLLPFIQNFDRYVFTMRKYIGPDLDYKKARIIPPAIDPLNKKNRPLGIEESDKIVRRYGVSATLPLISQISRFDPWKDPWGVVDAYRIAKKEFPALQLALIGVFAQDDPEAKLIVEDLKKYAKGDPNVFILSNLDGVGDVEVNAFQVASDIVIQKSTKEGFGLTVSEGMWKGKPVIGGKAGGIVEQIEDGKNGFLVTTVSETAEKIIYLLKNPEKANEIGREGRETVRDKFLITRLLLDHLKLYDELI